MIKPRTASIGGIIALLMNVLCFVVTERSNFKTGMQRGDFKMFYAAATALRMEARRFTTAPSKRSSNAPYFLNCLNLSASRFILIHRLSCSSICHFRFCLTSRRAFCGSWHRLALPLFRLAC